MKVNLFSKGMVKKELHQPCTKVIKAAARFVGYRESELKVTFSHSYRYAGFCRGRRNIFLTPPKHRNRDILMQACYFFETTCHELCHALDLIEDGYFAKGERAEIKVYDRLYDISGGGIMQTHCWSSEIKVPKYVQTVILELALILEELEVE